MSTELPGGGDPPRPAWDQLVVMIVATVVVTIAVLLTIQYLSRHLRWVSDPATPANPARPARPDEKKEFPRTRMSPADGRSVG